MDEVELSDFGFCGDLASLLCEGMSKSGSACFVDGDIRPGGESHGLLTEVRAFASVPGKVVVEAIASRRDAASLGATAYVLANERLVPAPSSTDERGAVLRVVLADPMRLAAVLAT